ncbi:sterol 3beta-glucosyltransferase [Microbacterium ginsengiterrae]|uniref:Sterol 3beta-glucosyltransferase n=1 Tax=Microbacterium ginsengiterrae TaxID=546115 RepID=A0A7W9CDF6_9MICO|nr:sterol 3beta-glucosyltransferase [Microbacterium ginsengiterrae]
MRILLATAGSRGDVEPFTALARRATAEGHHVLLVAPDNSGADLSGIDVRSMSVDYTRMIEEQGVSLMAALRSYSSVIRPTMNAVIVEPARIAREYRPDVVVAHPKVLSAPLIAEALDVPYVLVELVPAMTPTRAFPAAGTTTRNLGFLNKLTYRFVAASGAMFANDLDQAAAVFGTRRRRPAGPAATLMPISSAILERPSDWPETVHLTGPWLTDRPRTVLSDDVRSFIAGGDFVYAGFGSMVAGNAEQRTREVLAATRSFGARALLVTGLGGLTTSPHLLGDDVHVVRSVDHTQVLPQAVAAIHHGGIGTLQTATRAGTVSVVIPFIADQPFWGARIHARRLGSAPIRQSRLTAARLRASLAETESYRPEVQRAALAMTREDGVGTALAVIVTTS